MEWKDHVDQVVEKLYLLRKIGRETNTRTDRAQSFVLRSLPDRMLAEVVMKLQQRESLDPLAGGAK